MEFKIYQTDKDSVMDIQNLLGFSWDSSKLTFPGIARETTKPLLILRKMMPQYVFDLVHLEGNPFTFVEIQTLLDGVAVSSRHLSDRIQVLNQYKSLVFLLDELANRYHELGSALACAMHSRLAYEEEALQWGMFRTGQVRISAQYHLPNAEALPILYENGIVAIADIKQPFERALAYFFWGALRQFFYDGNKRCARAVMNYILMSHGYFYLSVQGEKQKEFERMMADFYEKKNATAGMKWLLNCYVACD